MTNACTCKAEHWQPHAEACPAYKPKPLLTVENIRSGAFPSDAHAVGFLLGEIERLQNDCQELTCGERKFVSSDTLRRELTGDVPNSQYAAVLKEAEKGEPVNTLDLIDALWWRVGNQRREIAKLHEKRRSPEPCEQRNEVNSIDDVAAICHSVTGLCCHILGSPGGPCTIGNCAAVRGYLGGPEFAQGASRDASSGEG